MMWVWFALFFYEHSQTQTVVVVGTSNPIASTATFSQVMGLQVVPLVCIVVLTYVHRSLRL